MSNRAIKFTEAVMDYNNTRGGLLDKFEDAVPEINGRKRKDNEVTDKVYDPVTFQNGLQEGDKSLSMRSPESMYSYRPDIKWSADVNFKAERPTKGVDEKEILNDISKSMSGKITDEYVNKLDLYSDIVIIK